jgi:hypothetical protein
MKSKSLLFLFLLIHCFNSAQTLKNVVVNLDGNGQIFDVKYITSIQKYIVVGKFSSIQGHAVNNMALLDANFNYVNATFPTVNNEIRCVETYLSTLYIGGMFTTVNGVAQQGLARLSVTAPAVATDPYVIAHVPAFQLMNSCPTFYHVADMDLNGTEVVVAGGFYDGGRNGILAFNVNTGALNSKFGGDYGLQSYYDQYYPNPLFSVDKLNSNYVLVGPSMTNGLYEDYPPSSGTELMLFNNSGVQLTGNTLPSFHTVGYYSSTFPTYQANEIAVLNDSIILTNLRHGSGAWSIGALNVVNPASYRVLQPVTLTEFNLGNPAIVGYNDNFYYIRNNKIERSAYAGTTGSGSGTVFSMVPANTITLGSGSATSLSAKMLYQANNFLIVSSDNLSTIAGQARTGLAIMCLEPEDAKRMNNLYNQLGQVGQPLPFDLDTVVCAGNIKAYTVPPANYAKGYKWTYNGPGVKYLIATNASAVPTENDFLTSGLPLNGSIYSETAFSYKIWLQYDESFTGGQLKVEPYSTCNTTTDYLFSKPATANLTLAPLPDINVADSLILTCINDTLNLVVTSGTPGVNFSWIDQNGSPVNTASIQLTLAGTQSVSFPRYFQATVSQSSGNMCKVRDSVFVNRNVISPQMALNGTLPVWNCYSDSMQITVVDTNSMAPEPVSVVSWNEATNDFSNSNPLTIYSDTAAIIFISTYPSNGCVDTSQFTLSTDLVHPTQQISGYSSGFQQVGTISCTNDSLLVVLSDYNSIDTDNYWVYQGDTLQDSVWITAGDPSYQQADTLGANLVTVTIDEYRMNPLNGCSTFGPLAAVVFDIRQPAVVSYTGPTSLTCSADELLLEHVPTFGITDQGWLLPNGSSNAADTLIVTGPGTFFYQVRGANGCLNTDTVPVQQTIELLFASAMDTLVCPGIPFTVTAVAIGPGTMTYSWSNGTQTILPNGVGGIDSVFIVQASNGQGCLGTDTLMARVTDPIQATFEAFSSCGSGGFIQVDSIYGGAAAELSDYLFAFNGGAYSTNFNFPVTQIATYPLLIKDTLGCEYAFTTEITGVIQTPGVNFLVSTYNQVGDTIALVNISDFSNFDGVFWTVPSGVDLIQASDSVAIFTASDTGWVQIQFTGYLIDTAVTPNDTCFYTFDKQVYFGHFSLNFGDSVVDNSISNVQLYPNPITAGQSQSVTLSFTIAGMQQYEVLFTSSLGEVLNAIADEGISEGEVTKTYTLPPLAAGTYLIHILAEYGAAQIKLIVQ